MKKILWISILALAVASTGFALKVTYAEPMMPSVIINELAWAGSTQSASDEWIELYNTTADPIDLTNWHLKKVDTTNGGLKDMLTITENTLDPNINTIVGYGYFIISNYNVEDSILAINPNYITSAVELNNSKLQIQLLDNEGVIIDTAGDSGTPFYPQSSTDHKSMERNDDADNGTVKTSWHTCTTTENLDDEISNCGTPLAVNSPKPLEPPQVTKIMPETAVVGSEFEATQILGDHFQTSDTIQIKISKGDLDIWGSAIGLVNPIVINHIIFNLQDAEPGSWDLTVINPDGQSGILEDALVLIEPEEEEGIEIPADTISLSELYPHPNSGEEEYIELYNSGDETVNLKGWKLDDQSPGGSATYTIKEDLLILPKQYLTLPKSQTKLTLNDTGDWTQLLWPNGTLTEVTPNYGTAKRGSAYAKINGSWVWTTTPTLNKINTLTIENDEKNSEDTETVSIDIPENLQITLDGETGDAGTIKLTWQIELPGALDAFLVFQSDNKDELGIEIKHLPITEKTAIISNLKSATTYHFTVGGNYNTERILSNQLKVTTSAKPVGMTGEERQVRISELLPNPNTNEEEFIELWNPGNEPINIAGWKLEDASGKGYIINPYDLEELIIATENIDEFFLEGGEYIYLPYSTTGIRLNNNGGEEVILFDGRSNIIDSVSYENTAKVGLVYVLAPNDSWWWSEESTAGKANDITFTGTSDNELISTGPTAQKTFLSWLIIGLFGIISSYIIHYYDQLIHKH